MKLIRTLFITGITAGLTACATFNPPPLSSGESEQSVIAKRGNPTARIPDGDQYLLEYSRYPWGQTKDMARFDRDGHLLSYEQVLTTENFATVKIGATTKTDILRMFGHPYETSYLSRLKLEVWTYPYKEQGVWNSLMHVHFDDAGVVRRMENGQDLRYDRDGRFGMFGRR